MPLRPSTPRPPARETSAASSGCSGRWPLRRAGSGGGCRVGRPALGARWGPVYERAFLLRHQDNDRDHRRVPRSPSNDTPVAILERWERCGGTWRVRSSSAAATAIDLCSCHGELLEQLVSRTPPWSGSLPNEARLQLSTSGRPGRRPASESAPSTRPAADRALPRRSSTGARTVASIGACKPHRSPSARRSLRAPEPSGEGLLARVRREPVDRARAAPDGALHGRPRLLHRQRRDPVAERRPARRLDRSIEWVVAGYGLTTAVGLDRRRPPRRPVRAPARVRGRAAACSRSPRRPAGSRRRAACSSRPGSCRALGAALVTPQVLSILSVVYQGKERARAFGIYGMTLGLAAVLRPADRRPADPGGRARPRLARVLPDQHPDRRSWRWRWCRALVPESKVRGRGPARSRGDGAGHRRPDRGRAAADRGPGAGLAAVDVAAASPPRRVILGRLRRPPAPAAQPRRRAAARPRAVPRAGVHGGPR